MKFGSFHKVAELEVCLETYYITGEERSRLTDLPRSGSTRALTYLDNVYILISIKPEICGGK
jgi:hypothetical protein